MKKERKIRILIYALFLVSASTFICGYFSSADYWKDQVTKDEYYYRLLDDTFPETEGGFTYIILRDGCYFVYHNITDEFWLDMMELNNTYPLPEWTVDFFKDQGIFHRPSGLMWINFEIKENPYK